MTKKEKDLRGWGKPAGQKDTSKDFCHYQLSWNGDITSYAKNIWSEKLHVIVIQLFM